MSKVPGNFFRTPGSKVTPTSGPAVFSVVSVIDLFVITRLRPIVSVTGDTWSRPGADEAPRNTRCIIIYTRLGAAKHFSAEIYREHDILSSRIDFHKKKILILLLVHLRSIGAFDKNRSRKSISIRSTLRSPTIDRLVTPEI